MPSQVPGHRDGPEVLAGTMRDADRAGPAAAQPKDSVSTIALSSRFFQ